jgi:hypothetical protein
MGILGSTFLGNRLFYVISKKSKDNLITVEDYLVYHDIIYYGTSDEKNKISFLMLDLEATGHITLETYENFWLQQMTMYGELINVKIQYDDETRDRTRQVF